MIRQLHLYDFRGFSRFRLGRLGRVNLLVGRNNSGKTSVLEALELLLTHGDFGAIWTSLSRRGERVVGEEDQGNGSEFDVSHLFHGHAPQVGAGFTILSENDLASQELTGRIREIHEEEDQERLPDIYMDFSSKMHLQWRSIGQAEETFIPLTGRLGVSVNVLRRRAQRPTENRVPTTFVTTDSLGTEEVISALSAVILDPEEELVLQALQIIDPTNERIAPIASYRSSSRRGGVVIKSRNSSGRLPIGTMGDGIWRLLALSLSLVRARGGVLMIDEIDTGLHYSALEDMWRLVGLTAQRLDIQVFATTHSSDCWKALAAVCADLGSGSEDATIHRIERDKTESVPFTEAEMIIAARSNLEIR